MQDLGISSIRMEANWSWIQPSGHEVFDWSQLDQEINSIRSARAEVSAVFLLMAARRKRPWPTPGAILHHRLRRQLSTGLSQPRSPNGILRKVSTPSRFGMSLMMRNFGSLNQTRLPIQLTWSLYIYTWQDTPTGPGIDDGFGLLTSGGSAKPAYAEVSQFDR
jgi:hypothetical protein